MTNTHVANKLLQLGLIKHIADHAIALDLVEAALVAAGDNTSGILRVTGTSNDRNRQIRGSSYSCIKLQPTQGWGEKNYLPVHGAATCQGPRAAQGWPSSFDRPRVKQ